jgi:hypothetical protein
MASNTSIKAIAFFTAVFQGGVFAFFHLVRCAGRKQTHIPIPGQQKVTYGTREKTQNRQLTRTCSDNDCR